MAKRFTDTEKYIDPWFRRLSTKNKVLWDWMLCNCDHAGILTIDFEFIEMVIGEKYEDDVMERYFGDRVVKLSIFKFFIPKFLRFQYGRLNPASKVHASVIQRLRDEGIIYNESDSLKEIENNARFIEYGKGMETIKDKKKDKAKIKAKDKIKEKEEGEEESEEAKPPMDFNKWLGPDNVRALSAEEKPVSVICDNASKGNATVDQVIELYNQELAGCGKLKICRALGSRSIKELLNTFSHIPTMSLWSELFGLVKANGTLTGASKTVFLATLDWLAKEDNASNVLAGKYDLPDPLTTNEKSIDDYVKSIKLEA